MQDVEIILTQMQIEVYWVSGPKKSGGDRYPWAKEKIQIDDDAMEEYWVSIRNQPENKSKSFV